MKRFLLLTLSALLIPIALAQSATTTVTVSWIAPTQNTDGSSITGTVSYNLYEGASVTGPWTMVQTQLSATSEQLTTISAGSCFAVTAVVNKVESTMAPAVCIEQPKAPTGLTTSVVLILTSQ